VQRARFGGGRDPRQRAHAPRELREFCRVGEGGDALLRTAISRLGFSARAYHRVLKIARTIADLEGAEEIATAHVAEAIQYRSLDRLLPAGHGALHVAQDNPRTLRGDLEVLRDLHQRLQTGDGTGVLRDPGLHLTVTIRKRVHIERRGQTPLPVLNVQEAVVVQVIVDVGHQDRVCNPAPEFFDIRARGHAVDAKHIDKFRVAVVARIIRFRAQHRGRRCIGQPTPGHPIETANQCDRNPIAVDQIRLGHGDACPRGQLHGEHLTLGHRTFILNAGELPNRQASLIVDDGTFGAKPAERGSAPAEVSQVCRRLRIRFHRLARPHQFS
jgi:hypothetical protein